MFSSFSFLICVVLVLSSSVYSSFGNLAVKYLRESKYLFGLFKKAGLINKCESIAKLFLTIR